MKLSSAEHLIHPSTKVTKLDKTLPALCVNVPLMSLVKEQGWALPKRSNFRYTVEQKKFLYDLFMEGEKTGKKKSPEEVENLVRGHFSSEKYVTVSQIRSLFSRFSKDLRDGNLKDPTQVEETQDFDDFADAVDDVVLILSTWEPSSWVVVKFGKQWYPGQILNAEERGVKIDEVWYMVNCMERKQYGVNRFKWPRVQDIEMYEKSDLLLQIKEVIPVQETEVIGSNEIVWCALDEKDFHDANDTLKRALREE